MMTAARPGTTKAASKADLFKDLNAVTSHSKAATKQFRTITFDANQQNTRNVERYFSSDRTQLDD